MLRKKSTLMKHIERTAYLETSSEIVIILAIGGWTKATGDCKCWKVGRLKAVQRWKDQL